MYYRECAAALVVYDLSKGETLESAEYWVRELREKESPYVIILVGNKSDTVKDLAAATEAGRAFAEQEKLPYFTSSAKTGEGVSAIFEHLVSKLPIEEKSSKASNVTVQPAAQRAGGAQAGSECAC